MTTRYVSEVNERTMVRLGELEGILDVAAYQQLYAKINAKKHSYADSPIMEFGKYQGLKSWREVLESDMQYVKWCVEQLFLQEKHAECLAFWGDAL